MNLYLSSRITMGLYFTYITNLTESICCQFIINNKMGYVLVVYRPKSQSTDDFKIIRIMSNVLNMSKAFDRVWHKGLMDNLKKAGVSDNLLTVFQSFLHNIYRRVLLNGRISHWLLIKADMLQGSILDPLLFLISINDLSNNLISNIKRFADAASISSTLNNINVSTEEMKIDLKRIS